VSLLTGIAVLTLAVVLGGLFALFREPGRRAMAAIRTFAVVAAASIALLHLLPEAISAVGYGAVLAALLGALGPALLERLIQTPASHAHEAPTTALAMGYAAVIAHQAGEGAALASLAETGSLSAAIVLAIAAHTVPLTMVVGIRVLEVRAGAGGGARAIGPALAGVIAATAIGAAIGPFIGGARLVTVQPWILAVVAGLLLHALSHDALAAPGETTRARLADMLAGWAGLGIASAGVEHGGWLDRIPLAGRVAGVVLIAGAIAARSFLARGHAHAHHPTPR
jgi:ZIP family zinc transporter